jgi:hypothetical protein
LSRFEHELNKAIFDREWLDIAKLFRLVVLVKFIKIFTIAGFNFSNELIDRIDGVFFKTGDFWYGKYWPKIETSVRRI